MHLAYWTGIFWQNLSFKALGIFIVFCTIQKSKQQKKIKHPGSLTFHAQTRKQGNAFNLLDEIQKQQKKTEKLHVSTRFLVPPVRQAPPLHVWVHFCPN